MSKKNFKNLAQYRAGKFYAQEARKAIPKAIRERVLKMFDGRCAYCGIIPRSLCCDHVVPYVLSNNNGEKNLLPSCTPCNIMKSVFTLEQFRNELSLQLERANKYSVNYRFALRYLQVIEIPGPIIFYFERTRSGE